MRKSHILALFTLVALLLASCSSVSLPETEDQTDGITVSENTQAAAPSETETDAQTSGEDKQEEADGITVSENTQTTVPSETEPDAQTSGKDEQDDAPSEQETIVAEVLPADSDFVRVCDYIPDIIVELKYATEDNFTGQIIYDFSDAYLRYGTVQKLAKVQQELQELGMGLKIWDAFRPTSAQFRLWEIYPDGAYVANPNTGFSSHSRGNTIDITLVDTDGNELHMPTPFDAFTSKADRDYSDCDEVSAQNATLLQTIMEKHGFKPYYAEWWHFSDTTSYDVEDTFAPPAN